MRELKEQHLVEAQHRRNALGFVLRFSGHRHVSKASIVWGEKADGSRVFITEAERGSKQGLSCECGSVLVAKQGKINAWHFAHKADGQSYCRLALFSALAHLTSNVLRQNGVVVPAAQHFKWRPEEIVPELLPNGVLLHTTREAAKLDIFVFFRKPNLLSFAGAQEQRGVSALMILLGGVECRDDAAIETGIHASCSRSWIYNRKGASTDAEAEESLPERLERMFPAEIERARLHAKSKR